MVHTAVVALLGVVVLGLRAVAGNVAFPGPTVVALRHLLVRAVACDVSVLAAAVVAHVRLLLRWALGSWG
jgi:hypothetical protein